MQPMLPSPSLGHAIYIISIKILEAFVLSSVLVSLGDFGVTCPSRDPWFAGSNPADVDGFFSGRKNPEHESSGRE